SLFSDRTVYCIDGDGSFIMHLGSAAVNAQNMRDNFRYIIINNGAHESVGGQPTAGFDMDIAGILKCCGFENVYIASDENSLRKNMELLKNQKKSALVIFTKQGSRKNLGRPTLSPLENKNALMENLKNESTDF
ncbi:MAG: thiamine pyrophosphate-dependent enzyme, partial [Ruminococcus sp.]|nr:thiamine pyrophosphate-dependent enzyme [Ruminococcus sp.]